MSSKLTRYMTGWAFLLPGLVVVFGLIAYPVVYNIWISLHDANLLTGEIGRFTELETYRKILTESGYWNSLRVGMIWTVCSLIGQLTLGLGIALLLNTQFKGRAIVQGFLIVPWILPSATVALTWRWLLNDVYGLISYILQSLGLVSSPVNWLGDPSFAVLSVIGVNIWRGFPLVMLLLYARLQTIPKEQYEAAIVDGASALQTFRYITIPNLLSVILIILLLRAMWIFNFFDLVWLLTNGGPGYATMIPPIYVYLRLFALFRLGEACAISVTLVVILLALAGPYIIVQRRVRYG